MHPEEILSSGLRRIYAIGLADTGERLDQLLGGYVGRSPCAFLRDAFQAHNISLMSASGRAAVVGEKVVQWNRAFYDDPDPGPAKMWKWSHHEESHVGLAGEEEHQFVRRYGYVFWNESMVDDSGWLDRGWRHIHSQL